MKNWNELLNKCKDYKHIVVSGPQRSGTTYVAKQLSIDLQYTHVDEFSFGIHSFPSFLTKLDIDNVVIQAPAITHTLHEISKEETLVIWMRRDFKEIEKSEDRIDWHPKYSSLEFKKYLLMFKESVDMVNSFTRSAPMKTHVFEKIQSSNMCVDWMYVDYDIVETSPNYIKPDLRKNFKPKQTK